MNKLLKFFKLEQKAAALDLSRELAYKGNFIMKCLAFAITDFIGPVLTLIIYSTTMGISGWSFHEFLLFQGSLIIVFGLGHLFVLALPYDTIRSIDRGEFDKYLTKPFHPLLYLITQSVLVEGVVEVMSGVVIAGFALYKLGISVFSLNLLGYLVLLFCGLLFQASVMIFVSAMAFIFVKSDALMNLYFKLSDFARWPLQVYGPFLQFFLVFLFPVAVSSFFPAQILINGMSAPFMFKAMIPVLTFFALSVIFWNHALRKYTSAGG